VAVATNAFSFGALIPNDAAMANNKTATDTVIALFPDFFEGHDEHRYDECCSGNGGHQEFREPINERRDRLRGQPIMLTFLIVFGFGRCVSDPWAERD
jgi:hypothetical protein